MALSPYRLGYKFEKRCEAYLKDKGWTIVSSRGSHSIVDFCAMQRRGITTLPRPAWPATKRLALLFVQCKRHGALPKKEWDELWRLADECEAVPILASQIGRRGGILWEELTGPRVPGKPRENKEAVTL